MRCKMNYWGHILDKDPGDFQLKLEERTSSASAQLKEISCAIPSRSSPGNVLYDEEFTEAYDSHDESAFNWQDSFDEERFLTVRRLLRVHITEVEEDLLYNMDD